MDDGYLLEVVPPIRRHSGGYVGVHVELVGRHFLFPFGNDGIVGAQGGDVRAVLENGRTADGTGLVINSSRGIIYASSGRDFAEAAGEAARKLNETINSYR